MNGLPPSPAPASASRDVVALFPGEIMRSPVSEHIRSSWHDVPWSEPQLVHHMLDQALRTGLTRRVRTFIERYLPYAAVKRSCH
jgi:hypothetical protein